MTSECTSELRVRYAETDQMGVVYHANYLVWCEIGRTDFIRAQGTSYAVLEEAGIRLAVSDVAIRYHSSARYDDPIRVRTRLIQVRSRSMNFAYRIEHAERQTVLASATTSLVSLDGAGRLVSLAVDLRHALDGAVSSAFVNAR